MCIICTEWQKEKLNLQEARNAAKEMFSAAELGSEEEEHYLDLLQAIDEDLKKEGKDDSTDSKRD